MFKLNKFIITCIFITGCSSCKSNNVSNIPIPTVNISPSGTASSSELNSEIKWVPFNSDIEKLLYESGQCAMFFFNQSLLECDSCYKMEETLKEPQVVNLVNNAFIPVRWPVESCVQDEECSSFMKNVLEIKTLPTTILIFHEESVPSLYGEGFVGPKVFSKFLTKNEELYNECVKIKERYDQ